MAGLFAMQVLVAGFCLLTPELHAVQAMPMHAADMASHCDDGKDKGDAAHGGHNGPCAHCDTPDELVPGKVSSSDAGIAFPVAFMALGVPEISVLKTISLFSRSPTGPPDSTTLLYTTTQRIRI